MRSSGQKDAIKSQAYPSENGLHSTNFKTQKTGSGWGLLRLPSRDTSCPLLAYLVLTTVHARPKLALL